MFKINNELNDFIELIKTTEDEQMISGKYIIESNDFKGWSHFYFA